MSQIITICPFSLLGQRENTKSHYKVIAMERNQWQTGNKQWPDPIGWTTTVRLLTQASWNIESNHLVQIPLPRQTASMGTQSGMVLACIAN